MGDDTGARVRAVAGLPELIADLIGSTGPFCSIEENDKAMEWALRAYRAGQAAAPDRHDTADFWFKVAVNTAKRAGLPCPRCMHPTKSHWTDNEESRPGCHRGECLCSWTPQELLIAYEYEDEAATPDGPRRWALPDEPGPEVRRLRPVERYPGDNSIWLDREPDNSGWRIVMRGRAGEPMEWVRAYSLGAGSVWGGRPLTDATPAADGQDGDGRG